MVNDGQAGAMEDSLEGKRRTWRRVLRWAWFPMAALAAVFIPVLSYLPIALQPAPLPAYLSPIVDALDALSLLAMLATVAVLVGLACAAFGFLVYSFWKPRLLWAFLQCLVLMGVLYGTFTVSRPLAYQAREQGLVRIALQAQPVLDALEAYKRDKGSYPEALEALVPDYIPRVPGTGAVVYPDFYYHRAEPDWPFRGFELGVETPLGGLNWDRYFFRPEGNYSSSTGEGSIERMGNWAYLHE